MKKWEKGQIFSTDLLFASTALIFILLTLFYYSSMQEERISAFERQKEMNETAFYSAALLAENGGSPDKWEGLNLDGINGIGLAGSSNVLQKSKIEKMAALCNADCNSMKEKIGLSKYNFRLGITDAKSGKLVYSIKNSIPAQNSDVAGYSRIVYFDGNVMMLKLEVFG